MTVGLSARNYLNNPVWDEDTIVLIVPGNAVPGTAEDLVAYLKQATAAGGIGYRPSAVIISNNSAANAYIRGDIIGAATAGAGLIIEPNGSLFMPIASEPKERILLETLTGLMVVCFK